MRSPDAGDVLLPALPPIRTRKAVAEAATAPEHASGLPSTPPEAEHLTAALVAAAEEEVVAESRTPTTVADEEEEETEPRTPTTVADEEEQAEPRTPTSEESMLRPPTECPAAPRKPKALVKTRPSPKRPLLYLDVPRDLSAVFVSLPPKKRIRARPCLVTCRPRCGPAGADGSAL